MDLAERTAAFYEALAAGDVRAFVTPRTDGDVDGRHQRVAAMARRFGDLQHDLLEVAVKRNVCFVHWQTRVATGLDILSWDQDGCLAHWGRQHAQDES